MFRNLKKTPRLYVSARDLLILLCCIVSGVSAQKTTEHRRALLINASDDPAHAVTIAKLGKTLESKGFVVTNLTPSQANDGLAYEKWLRAIPTLSASIIYYCGKLETVKSNDGKRILYAFKLTGQESLPPINKPTGRERKEEPGLTTTHLGQKLGLTTARQNLVLIDCLGFDDTVKTGKTEVELFTEAQGGTRGDLHSVFYPGKDAFHPRFKDDPPVRGPVLAADLTAALESGAEILTSFNERAYQALPRYSKTFELLHEPAEVCSPPDQLREGRFAGDQWVDPLGICYVWCPAGKFRMGDAQFDDAQPVEVTLTKGFWIGKYELLQKEPIQFGGGPTVINKRSDGSTQRWLPRACGIPFSDAIPKFVDWLAYRGETGQAFDGWTYDLPTEAEWEYACRAGSAAGLPSEIKDLGQFGNFADLSLYNDREWMPYLYACQETDDGYGRTFADAGRFRPNAWGIHDMLGNVSENVADIYNDHLIGGTDPLNLNFELGRDFRSLCPTRGGAWSSPPEYLHAAHRNPIFGIRQIGGLTPLAVSGVRLVIRQGQRRSRSGDELMAEKKAEIQKQKSK